MRPAAPFSATAVPLAAADSTEILASVADGVGCITLATESCPLAHQSISCSDEPEDN